MVPTLLHADTLAAEGNPVQWDAPQRLAAKLGSRHDGERFVLLHQHDSAMAGELVQVLDHTYDDFFLYLRRAGLDVTEPTDKLQILCFAGLGDYRDYSLKADYADLSRLIGYYSAHTNRIALHCRLDRDAVGMAQDFEMVRHEAIHQLAFNSGLQRRDVTYPIWFAEGLATLLEVPIEANAGIAVDHRARRNALLSLYNNGRILPLSHFSIITRVSRDSHDSSTQDIYNQAWGFFAFCMAERREQLIRYMQLMLDAPPGPAGRRHLKAVFEEAFGSTNQIEKDWLHFLGRLGEEQPPELHVVQAEVTP